MIKGLTIELGGAEYVVPPMTLGTIEVYEDKLEDLAGMANKDVRALILDVGLASLNRNYPDMTRDELKEIVDIGNMNDLLDACMDVSGLKRKALEAGEAQGQS
jgi:hypothetical protein